MDEPETDYERKIREMNKALRDQIRTGNHSLIEEEESSSAMVAEVSPENAPLEGSRG